MPEAHSVHSVGLLRLLESCDSVTWRSWRLEMIASRETKRLGSFSFRTSTPQSFVIVTWCQCVAQSGHAQPRWCLASPLHPSSLSAKTTTFSSCLGVHNG